MNYKSKYTEDTLNQLINMKLEGISSRKIAKDLLGRKSKKSTVNDIFSAYLQGRLKVGCEQKFPKILFIDVEVAPTLAYVFPRFKAHVSPEAVVKEPYMLTWAAKWLGTEEVFSDKLTNHELFYTDHHDDKYIIKSVRDLLDEADIIIAHNERFDEGWCLQQICKHGLKPPSPFKRICTLKALKGAFTLPSNSLQSACKYFGVPLKMENSGMKLWKYCGFGHRPSFDEMEDYNKQDIVALEGLYYKILPFIKSHPNLALYFENTTKRCPRCTSEDIELSTKHAYTGISKFSVYTCNSCGTHIRDRINVKTKEERCNILTNVI